MPMVTETDEANRLVTNREPKAPRKAGDPGSMADQAVKDAIVVIAVCWLILFVLAYSLRKHNI